MYLDILKYFNDDGSENVNVSKRVEFFFHYWQFVFNKPITSTDSFYLKSHRTIIEKVQLQVDGNFKNAKSRILYFFANDLLYNNSNIIIRKMTGTKVRRAVTSLKKLVNASTSWNENKKNKIYTQLNILQKWLKDDYSVLVSKCLLDLLEKNEPLNQADLTSIKQLINCLIVELFHKGLSKKYIRELPESINDPKRFPFKKIFSDFTSKEEYEEYKNETMASLTLKDQVEAVVTVLNRPNRVRNLVFRVFNVNHRISGLLVFFNVDFYNPQKNPKIVHRLPIKIMEETFTHDPVIDYKDGSTCNACVEVEGIQEEQLIRIGYKKVKAVLNILNRELGIHGSVHPKSVFITNDKFDHIWGSTEAINPNFKAVDEIKDGQGERLFYLNEIKLYQEEDKKVFDFLSSVSETLTDTEYFNPEKIWMALEALLHLGEKEMKELFFAVFKIYLHKNHDIQWRAYLTNTLNGFMVHPELHYSITPEEARKLSLDGTRNSYSLPKFRKNIYSLSARTELPFIVDTAASITEYYGNTSIFYQKLKNYIDYFITELYAQRNLTLHSNLSDELFLLKQDECKVMINIFTEIFLHWYLKNPKSKNINKTIKRIETKAAQFV